MHPILRNIAEATLHQPKSGSILRNRPERMCFDPLRTVQDFHQIMFFCLYYDGWGGEVISYLSDFSPLIAERSIASTLISVIVSSYNPYLCKSKQAHHAGIQRVGVKFLLNQAFPSGLHHPV